MYLHGDNCLTLVLASAVEKVVEIGLSGFSTLKVLLID